MPTIYTGDDVRRARLEAAEYVSRSNLGVVTLSLLAGFMAVAIFGPGILSGPWLPVAALLALLGLTHALTRPVRRIREGNAQAASVESSGSTSASQAASRN